MTDNIALKIKHKCVTKSKKYKDLFEHVANGAICCQKSYLNGGKVLKCRKTYDVVGFY